MYQFFTDSSSIGEEYITITGTDVNHIKNVLRMQIGEHIGISDGETDWIYVCEIAEFGAEEILAKRIEKQPSGRELPAKIYLFQGLPKNDKMELIVQKAVELGAYQVIPVATKRAVVKLDAKKAQAKVKRWNAIAESAAKQSKRMLIPTVHEVMNFQEALNYACEMDLAVVPYENAENMQETKKILKRADGARSIAVFIGPEGGFEEQEIAAALEKQIYPITLGKRILRTETAGLAILSVLMFQLEA